LIRERLMRIGKGAKNLFGLAKDGPSPKAPPADDAILPTKIEGTPYVSKRYVVESGIPH
jgi:hypothetical protein